MGWIIAAVVVVVAVVAYAIYTAVTSQDGGEADPLGGASQDAEAQDNAPVGGDQAQPCAAKQEKKVTHAQLQIMEITFAGNHVIDKDTQGPFTAPEWIRGRAPSDQSPICYTRNTTVQMAAKFAVTQAPSASESVEIRAEAMVGTSRIQWTAAVTVNPTDTEVVAPGVATSDKLPNHVACYDTISINWEYNPAATGWQSAGTSEHLLYLLLGAPTGTAVYWTLVDISCRAAHGSATESDVVTKSFGKVMTRSLKRKRDDHDLTYWNPNTTDATNTKKLLARADGSGQCGSWSEFLIDMWRVHGITGADKILIIVDQARMSTTGFLVKNWTFGATASHPVPFTHEMYTECTEDPGVPGQNNANPPPAFFNHFIVRKGGKFYDPSYGSSPVATQSPWESGAIDGLFLKGSPSRCGYPKASNLGNLLEFWDLTTSTKI